jgi:hypothetical protein
VLICAPHIEDAAALSVHHEVGLALAPSPRGSINVSVEEMHVSLLCAFHERPTIKQIRTKRKDRKKKLSAIYYSEMERQVLVRPVGSSGTPVGLHATTRPPDGDDFMMRQISAVAASSTPFPLGKALLILIKADAKSLRLDTFTTSTSATTGTCLVFLTLQDPVLQVASFYAAGVKQALDSLVATLGQADDRMAAMRSICSVLLEQVAAGPFLALPTSAA